MAYKDPLVKKQKNHEWYVRTRKNNAEYKKKKKEYDKTYHKTYKNPNLTPEKSREYSKNYKLRNIEKVRKADREYKRKIYSRVRAYHRKYMENHPDKKRQYALRYKLSGRQRASRIKHRYGILLDDVCTLLKSQGQICPICKKGFLHQQMCIDHDHKTGKVRGIVHRQCNLLLGFAGDDPVILKNAIKYLQKEVK